MAAELQLRAADGRLFTVDRPVRIGRDRSCEVRLDDGLVSRVHATVWPEGAALRIRDEGSSNGTFFAGERLAPQRVYNLREGDAVRVGQMVLTVERAPERPAVAAGTAPLAAEPPPLTPDERAPVSSPPTVNMPAQPRAAVPVLAAAVEEPPATAGAPGPAPRPLAAPAGRRARTPALAVGGCLVVCLLVVCASGGVLAVQRPPFAQTALAQIAPGVVLPGMGTPGAPAGPATVPPGDLRLTLLPAEPPPTPLPPAAFAASQHSLAADVAALNRAELVLIHKLLGQASRPGPGLARFLRQFEPATDADFAFLEKQGLKVHFGANTLADTAAAQGGGDNPAAQALADLYASVAQQALGVTLKVNDLRNQWRDGTLDAATVAELLARASAALWNPEVTEPGAAGNPFVPYAGQPARSAAQPVDAGALAGAGANPVGWVAAGPATGSETIPLPPSADLTGPRPSPAELAALASDTGGTAAQLIEAALQDFSARWPASVTSTTDGSPGTVTVPLLPVVVADPQTAGNGQAPPAFPGGKLGVIADDGNDAGLVGTLFGLDNNNQPAVEAQTAIEARPPVVALTISNLRLTGVTMRPRDTFSTFEADVQYEFDVTWASDLVAPRFELSCAGSNQFDVTSAAGSQHVFAKGLLILYPGVEDAYCYAARNGHTLGSASLRFLVGDAAGATQRAQQVGTDSEEFSLTYQAESVATEAAQQTRSASTQAMAQTLRAVETEVAGTQAAEFAATVTALAGGADRFATQTAAALAGDSDNDGVANADDRCFDQAETKNGWRDEDGCPDVSPQVNVEADFSERVTNGPLNAFGTTASLVADFGAGTVSGVLVGGGSWDDSYFCFNRSDPGEIYQTVAAEYEASYVASVTGTAAGGAFSGPIKAEGVTTITLLQDFTHEECTHLNGSVDTDVWNGAGTLSGTWDGNTFATLSTSWAVDDIRFAGTWSGTVTLTEP